jgi:hypothetical protein
MVSDKTNSDLEKLSRLEKELIEKLQVCILNKNLNKRQLPHAYNY